MRRVVISGLGVVSCLGNSQDEVVESLRAGRSGISYNESYAEMGLRSQISGSIDIDLTEHIDRKVRRFMGDAAAYSYIAMQQAIDDSGLDESDISIHARDSSPHPVARRAQILLRAQTSYAKKAYGKWGHTWSRER